VDSSQPTLISAAWKHPVLVVLIVALFVVAGLGVLGLQGGDPQFAAEALVVLQDPDAEDSGATSRFVVEQVEIMGSPIVAEAAATHIADEYGLEVTADELLASTSISSSLDSNLVFLSAIDDDAESAIAMVNGLANGYQDVSNRQASQTSVAALERIDAQVEAVEERLDEVSQDIQVERDADAELRRLEDQFREALALIADLQLELADASEAQEDAIRAEMADAQLRVDNYQRAQAASRDSPELQALLLEQTQLIERRTELIQQGDQISIDTELAPGAVALLQPAVLAGAFSETSPTRVMAVAIALGVAAAVGAAYLLELRRRRFSGRLEPRAILGVPLLADVPSFSDENLMSPLPVRDAPDSAAAEGFRFAAASISEAMRSREAKSVMLVGSTVGQGKSTCIVNTAMADARRGHAVLLIDCDFGTQDAARLMLGSESVNRTGLVDIVEDGIDLERAVTNLSLGDRASLSLMGQGTRPMTASLLLGAESVGVFDQANERYDAVFVDGPPLLQVAYSSTLANQVDALVVVVSHGTPVRELEDLVSRLQLIDTPVLGYLYNRSPLRREMTRRDGSMRDIFQEESNPARRQFWQRAGR
jgi:Mrp family chromosome partitioning ATPase/capsular polysaccharide biosynthesis protein